MDPIIWAAIIASAVSAIGNATTILVARFGRDAQREQMTISARVELAKVNAEAERVRDERREVARRERRELYGRTMVAIARLDHYGSRRAVPTDDEYLDANHDFEQLHSEVLLLATQNVEDAMAGVLAALMAIGVEMDRFPGGPAERYRAAYRENQRGDALTAARGVLIAEMHNDVTAPHLPA